MIKITEQVPLVSIIVPVFNAKNFLEQCLDSLLQQTYKNIEILVINDGSTDGSDQIIRRYTELDSRIQFINKQNSGYGDTCNHGISKSTGQYISIVEPDDYVSNHYVEFLVKDALTSNADVVKGFFYEVYKESIRKPKFLNFDKIPDDVFSIEDNSLLLTYHPSIWSCLYKKTFIQENHIKFQRLPGAGWADNLFQIKTLVKASKIFVNKHSFNYFYRLRHEDPSEDLTNPFLPYYRSLEIHKWLDENQINSKRILSSLLRREFTYLNQVLRMPEQKNEKDVVSVLCKFSTLILQYDEIYKCFTPKERDLLKSLIIHSSRVRRKALFKLKFKKNFKIHLTKNERTVILFGIKFISNKNYE